MAFSGLVPAQSLHRMAYNALQYCSKDSTVKGATLWTHWDDTLSVTASDDLFAINDIVDIDGDVYLETRSFGLTLKALQELEKYLRDESEDFDLSKITFDEVPFDHLKSAYNLIFTEPDRKGRDALDGFCVNPDRLRRLSLLKPKGYPIALRAAENPQGEAMLLFRYGPTVRGAISLLDEGVLAGIYSGEELWR
jgi:hypothetical protein